MVPAKRYFTRSLGAFAEGKGEIFSNPLIAEIGQKHHKSVGQIVLRWLIQRGIIVIPKSVHSERQKENLAIFDFELTAADMELIGSLDKNASQFFDHTIQTRLNRFLEQV